MPLEQRQLTLADGTQLWLNTASAVQPLGRPRARCNVQLGMCATPSDAGAAPAPQTGAGGALAIIIVGTASGRPAFLKSSSMVNSRSLRTPLARRGLAT